MIRRALIPLAVAASLAAGCNGSSSSDGTSEPTASGGPSVPTSQTLPPQGTAKLPDGRVYTVAAPGQTLKLDDVTLKIDRLVWQRAAAGGTYPPGTRWIATADVTMGNRSSDPQTVGETQIWLLAGSSTFVANPGGIVGERVPAGGTRNGKVGFYVPRKAVGGLLVYRFADATAIAKATHVGVARYRAR